MAEDPATNRSAPLYHPRQQRWRDHFTWSDDFTEIIGRTPTGRATVMALKLNRAGLVHLRRVLYIVEEHPPVEPQDIRRELRDYGAEEKLAGGPMMESAISHTAALLAVARQHHVPVANCFVSYPNSASAPYWKIASVTRDFMRGSQEAELDSRIVDHQYGFRIMLVEDCCSDNDRQPHLDTLRDVRRRYADIVQAEDVIAHIIANATRATRQVG